MTSYLNTSLDAKTALQLGAGFGVRTGRSSCPVAMGRVGSPEAIAMAGGAAIAHDVRTADGNLHALAARCAG